LTIKLTRHTAASASIQLHSLSSRTQFLEFKKTVIPSAASISRSELDAQSRDLLFCLDLCKGHHTPRKSYEP